MVWTLLGLLVGAALGAALNIWVLFPLYDRVADWWEARADG